jgi:C-terminal processing protease CtpA/Prc
MTARKPFLGGVLSMLLAPLLSTPGLGQSPAPATSAAEPSVASDDEFRVVLDDVEAAEVTALLAKLGSPKPGDREQAADRLASLGAKAFPQLREAYARAEDLEVRLRIEEIVQDAYLSLHVYNKNAFLGIRQSQVPIQPAGNSKIPQGNVGIRVEQVITGTAAEAAGLQAQDIIVAVDDEYISGNHPNPVQWFVEAIRTRGPGTKMRLLVLRKDDPFEIEATLRARPKNLYAGQGPVTQMLVEQERRFAGWWAKHFAAEAGAHGEPEQPSPR